VGAIERLNASLLERVENAETHAGVVFEINRCELTLGGHFQGIILLHDPINENPGATI
jgi:hypothetical protein